MFLPEELNIVMRLNYPRQRIVKWLPVHLDMMTLNEFDARNVDMYRENLLRVQHTGLCFSAFDGQKIYAMFGLWQLWPGVCECFLIPSADIGKKVHRFHRGSLLFFNHAVNKMDIKRLQIVVSSDNVLAVEWAERCYFIKEGLMKNWSPQLVDSFIMARIEN